MRLFFGLAAPPEAAVAIADWRDRRFPASGRPALELNQVGYWPRTGICWLGPRQWPVAMDKLAARLGAIGAAQGGMRTRRRYTPHITLYRGCESPPPAPLEEPAFSLTFDHFHLYASHREANGVAYRELESWDL